LALTGCFLSSILEREYACGPRAAERAAKAPSFNHWIAKLPHGHATCAAAQRLPPTNLSANARWLGTASEDRQENAPRHSSQRAGGLRSNLSCVCRAKMQADVQSRLMRENGIRTRIRRRFRRTADSGHKGLFASELLAATKCLVTGGASNTFEWLRSSFAKNSSALAK
jgi:hypothetical protein